MMISSRNLGVTLALSSILLAGCSGSDDTETLCLSPGFANVDITFRGFDEHVSQTFKVRVVQFGDEIDRRVISAIPAPDFSVRDLGAFCDTTTVIDFYADVDGDGVYGAPPADHAWRLGNVNIRRERSLLTFDHNDNHIDIQFPD